MILSMNLHNKNGLLITFCGLDGCGKTTMINRLRQTLKKSNQSFIVTKQPTNNVRESKIFRTFTDSEQHDEYDYRSLSLLAASDRIQHSHNVILPALEDGKIVISDRYFYSCLANLRARGYCNDNWIYEVASFIPKPDISFFLDVSVETAIKRVKSRETEKERWIDIPLQYKLREEYLTICKSIKGTLIESCNSEDNTFSEILATINNYKQNWRR